MNTQGGPNPPSLNTRLAIIALVVAVIVLGGVIFMVIRATGGDEPAPQLTTTVTDDSSGEDGTGTATINYPRTPTSPPLIINQVNWDRELQPDLSGAYLESVIYFDLTGDGQDEAIVRLRYEGAGRVLDYHVYTIENNKVFQLYGDGNLKQGNVELGVEPGTLVVTDYQYQAGDPDCCPSLPHSRTYSWSAASRNFVLVNEY